jgi:hypothetical protein
MTKTRLDRMIESIHTFNVDKIIDDNLDSEFSSIKELQNEANKVANYMRIFKIGWKVKSFKKEKDATKKLRRVLQKWLLPGNDPTKPVSMDYSKLKKSIKDEVVEYDKDGKPNFKDYEIERVARTELSSMRELNKLLRWKENGITQVQHKTTISPTTGEKDRLFNNRIFEIDYLLKNPDDRIPLHPNCLINWRTPILTEDGYKPIKHITLNDKVLTHKGRFKEVIDIHNNSTNEYYNIELNYKESNLCVTGNHPILTKRGWINVEDLKHDDEVCMLATRCKMVEQQEFIFVKIKSIKKKKSLKKLKTYNISVKDDESYIAQNIVVHNCRCRYLMYK